MEDRIQDVRDYMGAVEKVLLSKVKALLNKTKLEKSFSTIDWNKYRGASQRKSRPGSKNDVITPRMP